MKLNKARKILKVGDAIKLTGSSGQVIYGQITGINVGNDMFFLRREGRIGNWEVDFEENWDVEVLKVVTYTHKGEFNLPTFDEAPRDKFLAGIEFTYKECLSIVRKKNADYAVSSDPFLNFRNASVVGVSPERAILVRVMDKISRISNLIDKDADVKDETIEDTIHDAINYLAILKEKIK